MDHQDDVVLHMALPGVILPETRAMGADQSSACAPRQIGCALCVQQFLASATRHAATEQDTAQRSALEMVGLGETLFRAVLEAAANLEHGAYDPADGFPFESVAAAVDEVFSTLRALLAGSRVVA
jgi:hypothetical protein